MARSLIYSSSTEFSSFLRNANILLFCSILPQALGVFPLFLFNLNQFDEATQSRVTMTVSRTRCASHGWIDYEKVCASPIPLTITILPETVPFLDMITAPWRRANYLRAHDLDSLTLRQALLASTAIPLVFPSQEISGQKFSGASYVDPLPGQVLYQDGARRIISIFLADNTIQNRADYPGITLVQRYFRFASHSELMRDGCLA